MEATQEVKQEDLSPEPEVKQPATGKSLIEEARAVAADLREQNKQRIEILKKEEEMIGRKEALMELGGDSTAGGRMAKKIETPEEYAAKVLNGEINPLE